MSRRIVGPFNRVEGDLEVQLEIADGKVNEAWVTSSLYRGFEQILRGKHPNDALVYTPRICGICSVSQSVAAAAALADAQNIKTPPNGELAINLILANENVADHLTHFYLFFMPDFAREIYQNEPWYEVVAKRFKAISGTATSDILPARAEFLHLMGILAGKWPHSLSIQPGGSSRSIEAKEQFRIQIILYSFRQFLEKNLFGDTLENIINLNSLDDLNAWADQGTIDSSDFRCFLHIAKALDLANLGKSENVFMSNGAYRIEGGHLFKQGVWHNELLPLNTDTIFEDVSHSWMVNQDSPKHPFDGVTQPDPDSAAAYTWCKAPRLDGQVVEVGALSRQLIDGHPLIRDLVNQNGSNVCYRVVARLLEMARVVVAMESWAKQFRQGEPYCNHADMPDDAQGAGLVEAARGSLGHWLRIENGRIENYQIIAPTTWNFSPRDSNEMPGALERALLNAPVREGEKDPVAVQHIVRSFDPCMVCTVH